MKNNSVNNLIDFFPNTIRDDISVGDGICGMIFSSIIFSGTGVRTNYNFA
jgi:hypothetical protein